MDYPESYRITFTGILVAFLELAFAYCLLCVSALVFIASKFLLYLPCPSSGMLGYQNVHKLLFDLPFEIILRIQKMAVASRTSVWHHQDQEEERKSSVGKDKNLELMNKVRLLEEAVEEERLARSALIVELEEERAASASAADEAMAMILRLQADKASLEMEGKQYERMIEEKFAYDEVEMNILKEILFKREREKHFLEKELETYKHIDDDDDDDQEAIVYDVHVIENDNNAKKKDVDAAEHKVRDCDDQVKQMDDLLKDSDSST
ncbi:myosin-binding protein 3 [Raphanus sativus]|uniref:Myosin-binding protein 3 n=1 Tax=Raphanus sativus TaxID=3726 RepID=A0A6J0KHL7_RAPSA|nr:myosin-binding protein 3 [Raphanus sativus]